MGETVFESYKSKDSPLMCENGNIFELKSKDIDVEEIKRNVDA